MAGVSVEGVGGGEEAEGEGEGGIRISIRGQDRGDKGNNNTTISSSMPCRTSTSRPRCPHTSGTTRLTTPSSAPLLVCGFSFGSVCVGMCGRESREAGMCLNARAGCGCVCACVCACVLLMCELESTKAARALVLRLWVGRYMNMGR